MDENRKNDRHVCLVPIEGKKGSVFDGTQSVDFSKGGLGFISKRRISVNEEIPIEIELTADDKPVFVIGKVQWAQRILGSKQYRIGVIFKDVLHGSKSRLSQYFTKTKMV